MTSDKPSDFASNNPNDSANDLYVAIATMRAHSERMRTIAAENLNLDRDAFIAEQAEIDRARQPYAPTPRPASPSYEGVLPHPRIGQVDAAAQHLERARLPDLNALAGMMIEMQGAQRAYEVNMQMMDATHAMMTRTMDVLRAGK